MVIIMLASKQSAGRLYDCSAGERDCHAHLRYAGGGAPGCSLCDAGENYSRRAGKYEPDSKYRLQARDAGHVTGVGTMESTRKRTRVRDRHRLKDAIWHKPKSNLHLLNKSALLAETFQHYYRVSHTASATQRMPSLCDAGARRFWPLRSKNSSSFLKKEPKNFCSFKYP
jgi:hypothetical protein